MIRDVLAGEHCPGCRISAVHPEGNIEAIAVDEILAQDHEGTVYRAVRRWHQCGVCGSVFVTVSWADILDAPKLAAWLRHHPVIPLPVDCPK